MSGRRRAADLSQTADAVEAALKAANLGEPAGRGHRDRRSERRRAADPAGHPGHRARARRHPGLRRVPLPIQLRASAQSSRRSTTCSITLAFLAFFRYDLSLNVIAAILTITGYSVNDTIVIFDRVRENMRGMRRDSLEQIVNVSVNQTLGRTIITAGTALLSVLALYLFGGEVLHGFAFTMLVGIVTGTYSSVFIAAAIVLIWQGTASR